MPSNLGRTLIVVAVAAMTVVVHIIAARSDFSWMWGAHFYGFYSRWLLVVATLGVSALTAIALVKPERLAATLAYLVPRTFSARQAIACASACVVAGTALFWLARISHTYLGDGNMIVEGIDRSQEVLEREPLTSILQYAVYHTTKPWFRNSNQSIELNAQDALAVGSVLAGAFFLIVAWLLAREITRFVDDEDKRHARLLTALLWLVVVTQGYMQLFFGYIENYTFHAVAVLAYLWLALRYLRGSGPLLLPALALALCFSLHLSSLVLGASFVVLTFFALKQREHRLSALRDLALATGAILAAMFALARIRVGYNPLATVAAMVQTAFTQESNRGYVFSSAHYRDFINEQLLIGPMAMILFLPSAVAALADTSVRRSPAAWFFFVGGLTQVGVSWMFGESNLGYARDWDLFAHSGIVLTTGSVVLLLLPRIRYAVAVAVLVCVIAASVYHTAPWIGVNADPDRSLARLQTLPLGRGRMEVVMSTYYRQRRDAANQRLWLQRAVQINPSNVNALYLLGMLDLDAGRYEHAAASLQEAVRVRPDKVAFRLSLVKALSALNRLPETIPHLEIVVRLEPQSLDARILLGEALTGAGRREESQAIFAQAESMCHSALEERPDDAEINTAYGFILLRTGRLEAAQRHLTKAIALNPRAGEPYCILGYVLRDLGQAADARRQFTTCLTLNPAFGRRWEIEQWLASNPR